MVERMTRRDFLLKAAVAGGGLLALPLLAACGGAAAPAATPQGSSGAAAPAATKPAAPAPAQPAATVLTAAKPVASGTTEANVPGPEVIAMPAQKAQVTLRFHMRSGGEKSEPAIYQYRPDEWAEATGNKYKLEPIPGDKNYVPKVETLAAAGTIGDLLFLGYTRGEYRQLVKFKVLEPIDGFMATHKIQKEEWVKPIIDSLTVDGKMYGFPKTSHPGDSYIWINLKMFKDAGIPEPPTYGNSFDDVRAWANKLSKGPKDNRDVYGFSSGIHDVQPFTNGIRQFGGDVVDADGVSSLPNPDGFMGWLNWNYQLVVQDRVHPFSEAVPNGDIAAVFAAQKVAMVHQQRSTQFAIVNAVKGAFEFTTIQYPRGPKAKGWGASIDTHCATAASKYKDEALSLTYALADKRFAYLVGKTQGYLTGRIDNLQDLGPYAQDHFIQLQEKCTEQEDPFWMPKNLRTYEVETAMNNQLDLVWLGKRQPDQSYLNDTKKALDDVLAKPE